MMAASIAVSIKQWSGTCLPCLPHAVIPTNSMQLQSYCWLVGQWLHTVCRYMECCHSLVNHIVLVDWHGQITVQPFWLRA